MMPLDPIQPASSVTRKPMAPPYVDEDPNMEMVENGLEVAEDEKRDAVTDLYEDAALASDETEAALDDIDYPEGGAKSTSPELSAIREKTQPR